MKLAPRRVTHTAPGVVLRPVVALDIDGTLGYYHEHFIRFAAMWLQKDLPAAWDGSQPFWRMFGVSKATYRQIKLCYRQGGMKRSMPVMPGAAALTRAVRQAGAEVWLCTTRPYLRLDNINPDTRFWLRHNRIQFDGVLFGEHKYNDLVTLVGKERVVAVLDDEAELCARAERVGLPVFMADREYNWQASFARMFNLEQAARDFTETITQWRKERGV